jgi:hypothetical protein
MGVRLSPARQEGYSSNLQRTGGGSSGAGLFSDVLGSIGLGLDMPKKKGGRKPKAQAHGAGIFSDVLGSIGLGLDMPKKKGGRKPKAAQPHGAGFLSDALGAIGLGLPMRMRDKKLGTKFTKAQRDKLHAHVAKAKGAGFANMFLKGLISPFSAVSKLAEHIPVLGKAVGSVANILPAAVTGLTGVQPLV